MNVHPPPWRLAAGFLLAPLAPCVVYAALFSGLAGQWSGFWFGVTAMIVVSEALCLLVALPLYLVLRRLRNIGPLECALSGVAVTVILNVAPLLISGGTGYSAGDAGGDTIVNGVITTHGYVSMLRVIAVQSVLGVAIALSFWVIAIRREPGVSE